MTTRCVLALALISAAGPACGGDDDSTIEPLFPADYAASYQEVRDCRNSNEHGLVYVRVLADEAALAPYRDRLAPFPEGAVVLKEEYDDSECAGEILQWTVMVKRPDGDAPDLLDWSWQGVDSDREVTENDAVRCAACHQMCGVPPDGYGGTCAVEDAGG